MTEPRYGLATGASGAARLALLNQVYGPACQALLDMLGVSPGIRVADIGCGTGNTTRWFAARVAHVDAVDFSPDQLAVARQSAEAEGLTNIRYVEASAYATGLPDACCDIVHCRLLLCHLNHPLDAIREMARLARPGGLVICCDLDISALASFPATECYVRVRNLIIAAARQRGADCELGPKLPRLFLQAGLPTPDLHLIHPVYLRGEEKRLWEYTFAEGQHYFLDSGMLTQEELFFLAQALAAVAADETIAVAQGLMPVCWARKT